MTSRRVKLVLIVASLLIAATALAQSVSRPTFLVLQRVQENMEEERYEEALAELEILVVDTQDNPYDYCQSVSCTHQYYAGQPAASAHCIGGGPGQHRITPGYSGGNESFLWHGFVRGRGI